MTQRNNSGGGRKVWRHGPVPPLAPLPKEVLECVSSPEKILKLLGVVDAIDASIAAALAEGRITTTCVPAPARELLHVYTMMIRVFQQDRYKGKYNMDEEDVSVLTLT